MAKIRDLQDAPDAKPEDVARVNEPMLQFFAYSHLPSQLRAASEPFHVLADHIVTTIPRNPERTVALRKLLEAKDCAVRAVLFRVTL